MPCWLSFTNVSTKVTIGHCLGFLSNTNHLPQRRFFNAIPFAHAVFMCPRCNGNVVARRHIRVAASERYTECMRSPVQPFIIAKAENGTQNVTIATAPKVSLLGNLLANQQRTFMIYFFHPRGTVFAFKFILTANWPASMGDNTFLRHFACWMHVVLTPSLEILESL